jgi:hypothetical protein
MPKTRQTRTWDNARLTIAPASRSVRQTIHSPRKVLLTHKQLHTFFLLRIMQSFISFMHFFRHHAIIYYPLIRRVRGNRWQSSPRSSMSMPVYTYTQVFLRLVGPIVRAQRLNHFAIKAFYASRNAFIAKCLRRCALTPMTPTNQLNRITKLNN